MVIPFPTEDVSIDHFHIRGLRARYQNEQQTPPRRQRCGGCSSRRMGVVRGRKQQSSYFTFALAAEDTEVDTFAGQCATSLTHCSSAE